MAINVHMNYATIISEKKSWPLTFRKINGKTKSKRRNVMAIINHATIILEKYFEH